MEELLREASIAAKQAGQRGVDVESVEMVTKVSTTGIDTLVKQPESPTDERVGYIKEIQSLSCALGSSMPWAWRCRVWSHSDVMRYDTLGTPFGRYSTLR